MSVKIFLFSTVVFFVLLNWACVTTSPKVPCSRLEQKLANGTRILIDVDNFFPMIRSMKSLKENGKYKRLDGKEGEKLTNYFYKRCGETEKPLTKAGLEELVNFLIMNQEAKRSLHHFTVLNCPLLKQSQKHYILETSGIHLCYYLFQKYDCCSKFSHV